MYAIDKAKENLGRVYGDKDICKLCCSPLPTLYAIQSPMHLDTLHEELKLLIEKTWSDTGNCEQFDA